MKAPACLAAALAYAEKLGWAVFPCIGKVPAISKENGGRGVHDATKDPTLIRAFWRKYPDANVAVACGEISGIVALDVDAHKGGEESLDALQAAHGPLHETVEQITGQGGRHLLYGHPGYRVKNISDSEESPSPLGHALDVRGDHGYIITAPSVHPISGRKYAWEGAHRPLEVPITPLPEWLGAMINGPASVDRAAHSPDVYLNLLKNPVAKGKRRPALIRLAGHLLRKNVNIDEVIHLLIAWDKVWCCPSLGVEEVLKHIDGIAKKEAQRRGGVV